MASLIVCPTLKWDLGFDQVHEGILDRLSAPKIGLRFL